MEEEEIWEEAIKVWDPDSETQPRWRVTRTMKSEEGALGVGPWVRSLLHLQHDHGTPIIQQEQRHPLQPSCSAGDKSADVRDRGGSRRSSEWAPVTAVQLYQLFLKSP